MLVGFAACQQAPTTSEEEQTPTLTAEQIKTLPFEELYSQSSVEQLDDPFTLIGEKWSVLTAGPKDGYNSMVASWGGWGILFNKPVIYHMLRSNRYTLELMRQEGRYTVSFFEEENKEQLMLFGSKSGRDSDKMKESTLSPIVTPSGLPTYREATLVLECRLMEVTTVSPKDYVDEEYVKFVEEAFAETKEYHKVVMSEIEKVWVRHPKAE